MGINLFLKQQEKLWLEVLQKKIGNEKMLSITRFIFLNEW